MVTYQKVTEKPNLENLYTVAIEQSGIRNTFNYLHKEYSPKLIINVLDLGNKDDLLGSMLVKKFGSFFEYEQMDINDEAMEKFAVRTSNRNHTTLLDFLKEREFNYVFALNVDSPQLTTSGNIYRQPAKNEEEFLILRSIENKVSERKGLYEAVVLLNAALVVAEGGKIVRGGIITEDVLDGIDRVLSGEGCQLSSVTNVDIGIESARQLAQYDVQRSGIMISPQTLESMAQDYLDFRVAIFDKVEPRNSEITIQSIIKVTREYLKLNIYFNKLVPLQST